MRGQPLRRRPVDHPASPGGEASRHTRRASGAALLVRAVPDSRSESAVGPGTGHPGGTPAERWLRTVRARPLERAVPFPGWARPLVDAIVGRRRPPQVTFGTATRSALATAGVTGAAWGGAVRLRRAPRETPEDLETIAHELSHTVTDASGPSFFEGATSDPGETRARALGRTVRGIAASLGSSPGLARRTAAALTGGPGATPAAGTPRLQRMARVPVRSALVSRSPAVGTLPVSRAAALAGGVSGTNGLDPEPSSPRSPVPSTVLQRAPSALPAVAERASSVLPAVTEGASPLTRGASETAAALLDRAGAAAGDTAAHAESAVRAAGGDVLGSLGAGGDAAHQLGYLLEALEERVIAELERRGGRYAGAF
jgi:hypothetical protein